MKRFALIALLCLLAGNAAGSGVFTAGNELYQKIKNCDEDGITNAMDCANSNGYVAAVHDTLVGIHQSPHVTMPLNLCSPDNITVGQARDVVFKYLKENPSTRNQSAWGLAAVALIDVWPCPNE